MDETISIVVPVYKVEKYLKRCIESILNQTYDKIEVILVDDGSPDRCGAVCDEYAQKDKRVNVIHRENGGLSAARNSGLKAATGEYILFVDSDDYIHPAMTEHLYKAACKGNAPIAVCDFIKVNEEETVQESMSCAEGNVAEITQKNGLEYILGESKITFTVVWNKLFKRELFDGICFPEGRIHEDEFVTYKLLHKADRICYLREGLYYYVQRQTSIMGEGSSLKTLQRLDAFQERMYYYKQRNMTNYEYQLLNHYRYFLNEFICNVYDKGRCTKKDIKPYSNYLRKIILTDIWKYRISMKTKLGYVLYALFPSFYRKVKVGDTGAKHMLS